MIIMRVLLVCPTPGPTPKGWGARGGPTKIQRFFKNEADQKPMLLHGGITKL